MFTGNVSMATPEVAHNCLLCTINTAFTSESLAGDFLRLVTCPFLRFLLTNTGHFLFGCLSTGGLNAEELS